MKHLLYIVLLAITPAPLLFGAEEAQQKSDSAKSPSAQPPPVYAAPAAQPPPGGQVYVYEQKPATGRAPLVTPQQAQTIVDKFKAAYPKLGNPRIVTYVNRHLVDETSGLKLIARTEKIDTTRSDKRGDGAEANSNTASTEKAENRYRLHEPAQVTLTDRQTVRDVERLFGRPLRNAGATLADQRTATQLIADQAKDAVASTAEQARKDREALANIADVAVEVLISSKNITMTDFTGEKTYTVPDIQATAIRLKDARILGQASTSDILGRDPRYDVREITEATALALMEDMLTGVDAAAASAK